VALVRVYCGLASADESVRGASAALLTIAVVDDAGRLLGVHEISDDPGGYAQLGTLLVERTSGFSDAAVAADSDDHTVTSLLTAAGRPLYVADDDATDDFAERFADDDSIEEMQAAPAARRAVGLARALQAGAIEAVTTPAPRELTSYKPILAAHVAMLTGRHAAAVALREVLRELYPAALRAYPDPAHPLAMAVLDALPEPGRVNVRGTDQEDIATEVVAELTRAGAGTEDQVTAAVTAIVVAINESPRRGGINKSLAGTAADTVRQAIGAVRSCDHACEALIGTLAARVSAPAAAVGTGRRAAGSRRAAEPAVSGRSPVRTADTGTRIGRRSRPEPAAGNAPVTPRPLTSPPVAPQPIMPPPLAPRPVTSRPVTPPPVAPAAAAGLPGRTPTTVPGNRPVSVPPPPPGMTPITPGSRTTPPRTPAAPTSPAEAGQQFRSTLADAAMGKARADRQRTVIPPRSTTRSQSPAADYSLPLPTQRPTEDAAPPGSRANWPLVAPADDDAVPAAAATSGAPSDGRVRPPWQDMPKEPPALRLVEPGSGNGSATGSSSIGEPPPLRLVDREPAARNGRAARRNGSNGNGNGSSGNTGGITVTALERSTQPPVPDEGDGDLLIFAAARSAWFTGHDDESNDLNWANPSDTGWRAAEKAATPSVAAETSAGLPKRVPQANLVPGSPLREERPLRIVRDAASIAAHTTGYFRGWRRGQEIGGYAIGGRPGREAAGGWDFTRDGQAEDYRNNAGYRSS
jgi:hypothetical protein